MTYKQTTEEMHRMTVEEFRESEKLPLTVVLDNVRSLNNIGSVFRTADAFLPPIRHPLGILLAPSSHPPRIILAF